MTRPVLYMAHPVSGDVDGNIKRALRWLAWLRAKFPNVTFSAPWIAGVLSVGSDGTEAQRESGLVDDCATLVRMDGIVLVGGRTSIGMRRERDSAIDVGGHVVDLTYLGDEPPDNWNQISQFAQGIWVDDMLRIARMKAARS